MKSSVVNMMFSACISFHFLIESITFIKYWLSFFIKEIFVTYFPELLHSLEAFIWFNDLDQFVMKEINMHLKIVLLLWSKSIVNCKMLITNSCIPLGITIVYSILNIVSSSQFTCRSWSSSTSSQETNASYIHVYCV